MCLPETGTSYEVLVKPGETKVIVIQNEAEYSSYRGPFRATLLAKDRAVKKVDRTVDPKIVERCLELGTKQARLDQYPGLYSMTLKHHPGYFIVYVNETKNVGITEDISFNLHNLRLLSEHTPQNCVQVLLGPGSRQVI